MAHPIPDKTDKIHDSHNKTHDPHHRPYDPHNQFHPKPQLKPQPKLHPQPHSRIRLGVVFGSRSVEHEVSIITACQLMRHVNDTQYELVPLYIDKQGRWWTGAELRDVQTFRHLNLQAPETQLSDINGPDINGTDIKLPDIKRIEFLPDPTADHGVDVIINCVHGGYGEDGTLAGLFDLAEVPYAAPGVVAAAVAIDKIITKHVAQAAGIPVTNYIWSTAAQWQHDPDSIVAQAATLTYPLFVKPATLGSSVGVTRVNQPNDLAAALDLAAHFDHRLIVEEMARDCIEVNVAVIGTHDAYEVSVSEQPVKVDEFLSYADKYERRGGKRSNNAGEKGSGSKGMAGLSRRIPAPITPDLQSRIQAAAQDLWHLLGGTGVARIDFFADPSSENFYLGEVNAPPGSMAFYLWEASGRTYAELIDHLVHQAQHRAEVLASKMHSIQSNILQQ